MSENRWATCDIVSIYIIYMVILHIIMLDMMCPVSNIHRVYTRDKESNNTNQGCMTDNDTGFWLSSDHIGIFARYGVKPKNCIFSRKIDPSHQK